MNINFVPNLFVLKISIVFSENNGFLKLSRVLRSRYVRLHKFLAINSIDVILILVFDIQLVYFICKKNASVQF